MGSQILLILVGATVGAVLGVIGTLFVQKLQENEVKKTLHAKVFEEVEYNSKKGIPMELTGNFRKFEISAWESLRGTSAFYDLPVGVRNSLDNYYLTLRWFNEGMLKWKKLEEKEEKELRTEDLAKLPEPYMKFLFEKKILKTENFTDNK